MLDFIIEFYDWFGGLCFGVFFDIWFNVIGIGWWWYFEENGFVFGESGLLIVGEVMFGRGMLFDWFGGEMGMFVSFVGVGY